jgi:hypothetical protein
MVDVPIDDEDPPPNPLVLHVSGSHGHVVECPGGRVATKAFLTKPWATPSTAVRTAPELPTAASQEASETRVSESMGTERSSAMARSTAARTPSRWSLVWTRRISCSVADRASNWWTLPWSASMSLDTADANALSRPWCSG